MKKTLLLLFFMLFLMHCKSKNEFEEPFLVATEVAVLDVNANSIDFNISYMVEFEPIANQDCLVESKDELNAQFIEPLIWSVTRGFIGKLDENGIESINKEDLKNEINKELLEGNISLNSKNFVDCPLRISMFAITRRN